MLGNLLGHPAYPIFLRVRVPHNCVYVPFPVNVTVVGGGRVTGQKGVGSTDNFIDCTPQSGTCYALVPHDTYTFNFQRGGGSGWHFFGWSSTTDTITGLATKLSPLSLSRPSGKFELTATFKPTPIIKVAFAGTGGGMVKDSDTNPHLIDCKSTDPTNALCQAKSFRIQLNPTADADSDFMGFDHGEPVPGIPDSVTAALAAGEEFTYTATFDKKIPANPLTGDFSGTCTRTQDYYNADPTVFSCGAGKPASVHVVVDGSAITITPLSGFTGPSTLPTLTATLNGSSFTASGTGTIAGYTGSNCQTTGTVTANAISFNPLQCTIPTGQVRYSFSGTK